MQISKELFESAKALATSWQTDISANRETNETAFHEMMQEMLKEPRNKIFLIELLDQSFRSHNPKRIANQLEYLFDKYGHTTIFSQFETLLIWMFRHLGIFLPALSVPLFIKYLRNDISQIVIKGEMKALSRHLKMRKKEGTRVNINLIGEAVLGEQEAQERIEKYIGALAHPDIDYISIKISTIFSQIAPLAHDWTVSQLVGRLSRIYHAAMTNTFVDIKGMRSHKFVNLDMEEYRDLHLTLDAFKQTLDLPQFQNFHAGIVLQTYLPDTLDAVKDLVAWAKKRVQKGDMPIKVRLVKGANQEMELTEAGLRGWPCVTYSEKAQSDANYKLVMNYLLDPEVAPFVHTGIASHNLFDQALGVVLAKERQVEAYHTAEMLEGMSETAYKRLKKANLDVILYAPIATAKTFTNAIAYLVRRFDENTAQENFLRHSFGLEVGSKAWMQLVESYELSIKKMEHLPLKPFRIQDRNKAVEKRVRIENYRFVNTQDTDFSLPQNRIWAEKVRNKWQNIATQGGYHAVPVVGGKHEGGEEIVAVIDKSQYHEKVIVGTYAKANAQQLEQAVAVAKADPDNWRTMDLAARQAILMDAAFEIEKRRGDLIGIAAAEVGKVFLETDVEVSEAIDFLNFYPYSVKKMHSYGPIEMKPKGVGLVISPWNFPVAIPAGGVAASLAAGNTVILKPASNAVLSAFMLCEALWAAGVSKNTLQFVPCSGAAAGEHLVSDKRVDFVIFTGGEQTAYEMLKKRPELRLSAETGGKDATIVTALADRDQAVKNVLASAFNNSGQKCSATSLLILEKELYDDEKFQNMLLDAATSLEVGSVWDFKNRIGTLSSLPAGHLHKALDYLDSKEHWLAAPEYEDENPYMLKPSIRYGTQKGDFCHMHELFGPVLSVMRAKNLDEGMDLVNATGYGLTSGLESLDKREQLQWERTIRAGNLYINRMTTGAIVLRQTFGGMGKSAIGSGRKAGGLNYVSQFMQIRSGKEVPRKSAVYEGSQALGELLARPHGFGDQLKDIDAVASEFAAALKAEFLQDHDYVVLRGERNTLRYIPVESVLLRCEDADDLDHLLLSAVAVKMTGARVLLSLPDNFQSKQLAWLAQNISVLLDKEDQVLIQDQKALSESFSSVERIRFLNAASVDTKLYEKAASQAKHIVCEPFVSCGRIELMHYFKEQSISNSYHRYGNLGEAALTNKEDF